MASGYGENSPVYSLLDDKDIAMLPPRQDTSSSTAISEDEFGKIVGLVEDIFVGEDFQARHTDYFTRHCTQFSTGTDPPMGSAELENLTKERFNIFRTYSVETAAFLEKELQRSLGETFEIDQFIQEVERRTAIAESAAASENGSVGNYSGGGGGEGEPNNSPKSPRSSAQNGNGEQAPLQDIASIMGGEIFEMLLTLKDYARFQELMVDYLQMIQGNTPDMEGLVSLRHISDDEEGDNQDS